MYIGRTGLGIVRHGLLIARFSVNINWEINQIASESCVVSREPDMEQDSIGISAICLGKKGEQKKVLLVYTPNLNTVFLLAQALPVISNLYLVYDLAG